MADSKDQGENHQWFPLSYDVTIDPEEISLIENEAPASNHDDKQKGKKERKEEVCEGAVKSADDNALVHDKDHSPLWSPLSYCVKLALYELGLSGEKDTRRDGSKSNATSAQKDQDVDQKEVEEKDQGEDEEENQEEDPTEDDSNSEFEDGPLAKKSDFASKVVRLISDVDSEKDLQEYESEDSESKVGESASIENIPLPREFQKFNQVMRLDPRKLQWIVSQNEDNENSDCDVDSGSLGIRQFRMCPDDEQSDAEGSLANAGKTYIVPSNATVTESESLWLDTESTLEPCFMEPSASEETLQTSTSLGSDAHDPELHAKFSDPTSQHKPTSQPVSPKQTNSEPSLCKPCKKTSDSASASTSYETISERTSPKSSTSAPTLQKQTPGHSSPKSPPSETSYDNIILYDPISQPTSPPSEPVSTSTSEIFFEASSDPTNFGAAKSPADPALEANAHQSAALKLTLLHGGNLREGAKGYPVSAAADGDMEPPRRKKAVKEEEAVHDEEMQKELEQKTWEVDISELKAVKPKAKGKVKKAQAAAKNAVRPYAEWPPNTATPKLMQQRKVMSLRRWYCISRPQYKASCGLSSVVSVWNYLFSTLGAGSAEPITQEQALTVLGFAPPFGEIRFGPFTGNKTLMRWFMMLNQHYKVRGHTYMLYKPRGRSQTYGVSAGEALGKLKAGLRGDQRAYIYHCYNHYFCPIGYEDVPLSAEHAYRTDMKEDECETWIIIGEPSRKQPVFHCKRWDDIAEDLNQECPFYHDIRRQWRGTQKLKTRKVGGNLHCIMAFERNKTPVAAKLPYYMRKKGIVEEMLS